ncbi:MAG: AsnC family transcriptional regulator [Candidatus Thorarchaeota archaeon]|nr:MAG: AsnC family transcriptional regulator [Candidatus Thorarchaeota archaeon]
MVKAYVLIKTASGSEDEVLRNILALSVVEEAHKVFGPYDIVVEVRGRDIESVVEIVTGRIRRIKGLFETQSLLVIDPELDLTSSSLAS